MPVNRKRARRDRTGTPSPWVDEYLKTGKKPKKGEPGYAEWCWYYLMKGNVRGLPEWPELHGGWYYKERGKK